MNKSILFPEVFFRVALSALIGVLGLFWIRYMIYSALPWGCYQGGATECVGGLPDWFISNQQRSLFIAWPMAIAMVISSNFLASAYLSNNDYFSKLGYFTLAWPLIDFLPLSIAGPFYVFCLPIGFILAIITSGISLVKRKHFGNLLSIAWSIAWIYLAFYYGDIIWGLTGD